MTPWLPRMRSPSKDPRDYQTGGRSQALRPPRTKPPTHMGPRAPQGVSYEHTSEELVARARCRAPELFHVQICFDGAATAGRRWPLTVSQN